MAQALKKLGQFSLDALHIAIQHGSLSEEAVLELEVMADNLEKAEMIEKPKVRSASKADIFARMKVSIEEKVALFQAEGKDYVLQEMLQIENPFKMSLEEISKTHKTVLTFEESAKVELLISRYYRGLLYIGAKAHFQVVDDFKTWLFREFKVSLITARRYISFAFLIKTFPMLIISGVSFSSLIENVNLIKEHFKDNEQLKESLCVLSPHGKEVCVISSVTFIHLTEQMKQSSDFEYSDTFADSSSKDGDKIFASWNASEQANELSRVGENDEFFEAE